MNANAQLGVSESGSPSYSHAIAVPPGIGNLVPNIGLQYSGGGVNGPVGLGWSVQGISAITRCASIRAIDGGPRAVDYSGNDKLCLDGQRLIQTDANGVVVNGGVVNPGPSNPFQSGDSLGGTGQVREYRTEKDSFARIRAYGSAGGVAANGPAYFKVWTKGGQIYEYGDNANATAKASITVQGGGPVSVWAVSRISDTLGNYIDFEYEQREVQWGSGPTAGSPTPGKEWNLLEIRYTGTSTAQPMNRVQFIYSDRVDTQDRSEAYHRGKKNVSIRRLDAVRTYTNWAGNVVPYGTLGQPTYPSTPPSTAIKVKAVKLTYEQGPVTKRSRVKNITECVGTNEAQCLPPVTFNYAAGGNDTYQQNLQFFGVSPLANVTLYDPSGSYGVIPLDFNGDGKTDLLRWSTNPAENRLYMSTGSGGFTQIPNGSGAGQFNITDQQLFGTAGCFFSMVADFNGDGLPDILR
ncbi:MAG: SpvB/TcaC N-terminal domain-containing protein, partial [Fimbriimonadaceae bacterium]